MGLAGARHGAARLQEMPPHKVGMLFLVLCESCGPVETSEIRASRCGCWLFPAAFNHSNHQLYLACHFRACNRTSELKPIIGLACTSLCGQYTVKTNELVGGSTVNAIYMEQAPLHKAKDTRISIWLRSVGHSSLISALGNKDIVLGDAVPRPEVRFRFKSKLGSVANWGP